MDNAMVLDWTIDQFFDKKHLGTIVREKGYSISSKLSTKCRRNIVQEPGINKVYELCMFSENNIKSHERIGEKSLQLIKLMLASYGLKLGGNYLDKLQQHQTKVSTQGTEPMSEPIFKASKVSSIDVTKKDVGLPPAILPSTPFLRATDTGFEYVSEKDIINYAVEKLLALMDKVA